MNAKYEEEPKEVGVKIEERGGGRAKGETAKMGKRLEKEREAR